MSNDNNITELRNILFDTLRGLKDKSIDIEHARAICETSQVIINSAKVEADYARFNKKRTTSFMHDQQLLGPSSDDTDVPDDQDQHELPDTSRIEPKLVTYSHRIGEGKKPIGTGNGKR